MTVINTHYISNATDGVEIAKMYLIYINPLNLNDIKLTNTIHVRKINLHPGSVHFWTKDSTKSPISGVSKQHFTIDIFRSLIIIVIHIKIYHI